ncbi:SMI1/KNR4 family protein [Flavobacterium sp. HSC-61S13]|uniref:SMI1/KNR4 family protein n=1 Tax=Flavobacterium sp. HSC-61S13 TaxID=2910963 RepID=UPI00209F6DFA|nr:SMI1/KNR4 family protein [Flavobacterium sp. HSC-61S13]MCP1997091.1 cell wall assembly regulator SMI1 [Flavobacterium sp. HSC-61S13]
MKAIKFENVEKGINWQDIKDIESEIGVILLENYKRLILKFNGGLTEDSSFIDVLLSIRYGEQTVQDMVKMHQILESNIPFNFLPIALDWSDNPITINLNIGEHYGEIVQFYFDTEQEPEVLAKALEELLGVENIDEL